jgi:hypothetical protein
LTLEEEKYYDNYFNTFSSDGWKQFISELQEIHDGYNLDTIQDLVQLKLIQGQRNILSRVLQFETGIRTAYDMIKEREAEADV